MVGDGAPGAAGRTFFARWLVVGNGPTVPCHATTAAQEFRLR